MKVGYPDTINNKAYQGEKSPFKMVDKSKADLDKDGKVSDYEQNRAEAAFGDAPLNYSPIKAKDIVADNQAKRKAAAEKAKKAEDAIRQSQSSSENTTEPTRKKTKIGRAIQARKERRAEKNPKVAERQEGNATRKKNKKDNKYAIKTQKSLVTKARQDKKTAKAVTRQTERLKKVTKKVGEKVSDVNKGTGLGISKNNPAIGNVVKNIVTAKEKKKKSPIDFASAAQRKAVWASKNEKKKK